MKLDRIIRLVPGYMIHDHVTDYDPARNVLMINQEKFKQATTQQRTELWRSTESLTSV